MSKNKFKAKSNPIEEGKYSVNNWYVADKGTEEKYDQKRRE